jgi:hypothetical protein
MSKASIICVIAALLTVGDATAKVRVYVGVAPPAPIVETPGPPPGPGYVWTPGYHRWEGGRYNWVAGQWLVPPRRHAHWVPGHWVRHHHQWYFVEGHWR